MLFTLLRCLDLTLLEVKERASALSIYEYEPFTPAEWIPSATCASLVMKSLKAAAETQQTSTHFSALNYTYGPGDRKPWS
jgi:hypothetical protein